MKSRPLLVWTLALGLAGLAAGAALSPQKLWPTVLIAGLYLLSLSLGSMAFLAIQRVCGARWDLGIRHVPRALAEGFWPGAALTAAALVAGQNGFYGWVQGPDGSHVAHSQQAWLSPAFRLARAGLYLAVWGAFLAAFRRAWRKGARSPEACASKIVEAQVLRSPEGAWSRDADSCGGVGLSAGFLVAFGVTLSLASFDWLMALEPGWFSTMFGVYMFAGVMSSTLAVVAAACITLKDGPLRGLVTDEHLLDLGRLLFAFTMFWAYIWYCQYMLIWYTNGPEEIPFFLRRHSGGWAVLSMTNVALNWLVPFLALMPQWAKRNEKILLRASLAVLLGRWLDLYIVVMPRFAGESPRFGPWEGLVFLGAGAFLALSLARRLCATDPAACVSAPEDARQSPGRAGT